MRPAPLESLHKKGSPPPAHFAIGEEPRSCLKNLSLKLPFLLRRETFRKSVREASVSTSTGSLQKIRLGNFRFCLGGKVLENLSRKLPFLLRREYFVKFLHIGVIYIITLRRLIYSCDTVKVTGNQFPAEKERVIRAFR